MPWVEVQRVSGKFVGTAQATTALGAGTTAGNTVVIACSGTGTVSVPTGFVKDSGTSVINVFVFRRGPAEGLAAGETSWTVGPSTSNAFRYDVFEFEGLDPDFPLDVATTSTGTTASSGTTPRSTTYDGLALVVHSVAESAATTTHTFSAQTNGFVEQTDDAIAGASTSQSQAVSWQPAQSLGTWESTATRTPDTGTWRNTIVVYTATGAKREPNIPYFWGFSSVLSGYPACHSVSPANNRYWETQTGTVTIDSGGLRLQGTAASAQIVGPAQGVLGTGNPKSNLARLRFKINSVSGDLDLAVNSATSGGGTVSVRYRSASQKIGLQLGTGTEQLSDQTVATGQWYDLEWRLLGTTTAMTCDWRVNYGSGWTDQTQATFTATGALAGWTPTLGWSAASTGDVSVAYAAYSVTPGHYPLGDYTVQFLGPDTAATPTVLGTSTNFRRFTANGTIDGAYDGPAIMTAVATWPPTFGASATGLACVTADASGIRIPFATYNAASNGGSIRAARAVAPIWAASTTAATIGLAGYDGTATATLFVEADPNADTSSTPPWVAVVWRPSNGWTQAKLDAAELRFISNDATPDIGPHAVGLEVLVQTAATQTLFGALSTAKQDPVTGGILAVTATPTAGYDGTLHYENPSSTNVAAPGGTTTTQVIDAPDAPTVQYVAFYPPPEDIPDA